MDTLMTIVGFLCGTAWRRRRFLSAFVAVCTLASVGISLTMKPIFRASTLLIPNQSSSGLASALGDLSGLVGQFGISAGAEDPSRIYPEILGSRALTHDILLSTVVDRDSTESVYLDRLGVSGDGQAERLEIATKIFQDERSRVILNPKNSSLKIVVFDRDPLVAATIANRMAEVLDRMNQRISRNNARERREFIAGRRQEVVAELEASEDELKVFRETNRQYASSPQLMLELERISRRVRLNEEVFLTLSRELELAKIDEINDVPVINVLDRALPMTSPHSPRPRLIVTSTLFFSFVVGLGLALAWEGRAQLLMAFKAARGDRGDAL